MNSRSLRTVLVVLVAILSPHESPCLAAYDSMNLQITEPKNAAEKLMKAGRYARSLTVFESNSQLYKDPSSFFHWLSCLYRLNENQKIVSACKRWLSLNPTESGEVPSFVFEFLGTGLYGQGNYRDAVDAFSKSIAYREQDSARLGRALSYEKLNEQKLAADDRRKLPTLSSTLAQRLDMTMDQQTGAPFYEFEFTSYPGKGSRQNWKEAIKIASNAKDLELAGEFEKATDLYSKAVKCFEFDPNIWEAYGLCSMTASVARSDNNEGLKIAEAAFKKAKSLNRNDWRMWNNSALLYFILNDTEMAKSEIRTTLSFASVPKLQQASLMHVSKLCTTIDFLEHNKQKVQEQLLRN